MKSKPSKSKPRKIKSDPEKAKLLNIKVPAGITLAAVVDHIVSSNKTNTANKLCCMMAAFNDVEAFARSTKDDIIEKLNNVHIEGSKKSLIGPTTRKALEELDRWIKSEKKKAEAEAIAASYEDPFGFPEDDEPKVSEADASASENQCEPASDGTEACDTASADKAACEELLAECEAREKVANEAMAEAEKAVAEANKARDDALLRVMELESAGRDATMSESRLEQSRIERELRSELSDVSEKLKRSELACVKANERSVQLESMLHTIGLDGDAIAKMAALISARDAAYDDAKKRMSQLSEVRKIVRERDAEILTYKKMIGELEQRDAALSASLSSMQRKCDETSPVSRSELACITERADRAATEASRLNFLLSQRTEEWGAEKSELERRISDLEAANERLTESNGRLKDENKRLEESAVYPVIPPAVPEQDDACERLREADIELARVKAEHAAYMRLVQAIKASVTASLDAL